MIRELTIKNLALIDSMHLELESGLTVFTGETGAGKSILLGAIGLLLGDRASSEQIRSGCDEAQVSGIFELDSIPPELRDLLNELSIPADDNHFIIRRKIAKNDRSRIYINDAPLSLSALKSIGNFLVDMHGQHEHQLLLDDRTHHTFIDRQESVQPDRREYDQLFGRHADLEAQVKQHDTSMRNLADKREIIEFQLDELKHAHLKDGEDVLLEEELALLSSAAQRLLSVNSIAGLLSDADNSSLQMQIRSIKRHLEQLVKFDKSALPWIEEIDTAVRIFAEFEQFCSSYLEDTGESVDPQRLEKINAKLARLQKLKKKYGTTLSGLIDKAASLQHELSQLDNSDSDRRELEKAALEARNACIVSGNKLTASRKAASKLFDAKITELMQQLGFNGGILRTHFSALDAPSLDGLETVSFYVRTNPGEAELPLAATASGGEISRIMLAIKTVLAECDFVPVLIFDEIDTGIGGTTASSVGNALLSLANSHQVLCISHLHQIASLADHHVRVYKETSEDRTVTRIVKLDKNERVAEIARMLGGDNTIALKHARVLLDTSFK